MAKYLEWKRRLLRHSECFCVEAEVLSAGMEMILKVCFFILTLATCLADPLIPTNKLSLATWTSYHQRDHMGPGTYAFGYDIEDPVTGNIQFRQEERHPNGTVTGTYGYVDADGRPNVVTYISDEYGYRAKLEIEGEPVKYFPDGPTFFGNSLQEQNTDSKYSRSPEGNDIQRRGLFLHSPVTTTQRVDHPSYYKYIRAIAVENKK